MKKFSLVMSGGGALGIAHSGVLADIEKEGLIPNEIIGTSMGGIIGACYAIGMSEKEIFKQMELFSNIFNWVSFSLYGNSIVSNKYKEIRELGKKLLILKLEEKDYFSSRRDKQ